MLIFLRNILQLILAPSKGWEDISACGTSPHKLLNVGLYPFLLLSSLSVFIQLLYNPDLSIVLLIERAVVVFVSFFVNFYFALIMFKTYFGKYSEGEPNERKCSIVILYTVSLLALANMIVNALPVHMGLEYLLPIFVALVMWKAQVYLRVKPEKEYHYLLFGIATVIIPGILLQTLFDKILG